MKVGNFAEWIQEAKALIDDCHGNIHCLNQAKVDSGNIFFILQNSLNNLISKEFISKSTGSRFLFFERS